MKRNILVAYWSYEGNSSNGRDHERKGDLKLAQLAHGYNNQFGSDDVVERIAPSTAGVKREASNFGKVYAFRIKDIVKLQTWGETL